MHGCHYVISPSFDTLGRSSLLVMAPDCELLFLLCSFLGQWNKWFTTEPCSVTCGTGVEKQKRRCKDLDGEIRHNVKCNGETVETRQNSCQKRECPGE